MAQPSRVFRVFISSTFDDLKAERDALQERVFPKLRDHCAENHYSFQAIDLRWGIGDEASAGQRTMRICIDEIARCQATTPRPNFLLLLGDRYGWRPLPEEVLGEEFDAVREHLDAEAAALAETWYKLDKNAVPEAYRLLPRGPNVTDLPREDAEKALKDAGFTVVVTEEFSDTVAVGIVAAQDPEPGARVDSGATIKILVSKGPRDGVAPRGTDTPGAETTVAERETVWDRVQRILAPALRQAARDAGLEERDPDAFMKYSASATEQEILAGALNDEVETKSVFAFVRTLEDLPEESGAKKYRDLTSDRTEDAEPKHGEIDTEAERLLVGLKERLQARLGDNVQQDTVAYADLIEYQEAVRERLEAVEREDAAAVDEATERLARLPFNAYLDRLCEAVLASLMPVIDAEMDRLGKGTTTTPAEEEAAHEAFRKERGSSFTGREEYLTAIGNYLSSPASHPLVVWGYGGSGKSALLAKAIEDAPDNPTTTLVHRFIGATPKSADIRSLLQDLFDAVGAAYQLEGEMPSDFNELVRAFRERLEAAGAKRPLLLFLDSLDQLSTTYGAQGFTWLPTNLPEGVWIVASIRAEEEDEATDAEATGTSSPSPMSGPLGTLQRTLPESALLELGPMSRSDAEKLLAKWLALAGRTLQDEQRAAVLDSFARYDPAEQRGLPLHLRLAFGRARDWSSYDAPEGIRDRVREMVAALYEHLEREHGPLLVGHTLAYLAATRNTMGLAEDEILDLLPTDKEVFDEFKSRSKHEVAEGRIPVIVWSRLYFDLAPYLGTRSSERVALLAFYHRELGEVATKRYLEGNRKERHGKLAAMLRAMADSKDMDGEWTHAWSGSPRALAELPYHLTGAEDWDNVFKVLTDFTFLEQKASKVGVVERPGSDEGTLYTGVYALLDDYENALAEFPAE